MADAETEAEWEKSKRIEAERMKAAKALAEEKPDKSNVAFLDPKETKTKGWSNDTNVILVSAERMGNRAIILAICGVVLMIIGFAGGMVTETSKLGMAGMLISSLPSGVGLLCMGLAVLMAIIAIGSEIYRKVKMGRNFSATFWSAIGAIGIVVLYFVAQWLIMRLG